LALSGARFGRKFSCMVLELGGYCVKLGKIIIESVIT